MLVGFVRDGTAQGPGIEGASVQAGELPAAVTDTDGFYRIEDVTPGDVTVRAQVAGRIPQSQVVAVLAGKTHWVSFALPPPDSHEVPSEGEAEGEGEIVVAEGPGDGPDDADNPEGPVGAPGAGGDVEGTSLTSSKKSGSVGCATTGGGAWWRPRR